MKVTLIASFVALATALPHQLVERDPQLIGNLAAGVGNLAGSLISLPVGLVSGITGGLVGGVADSLGDIVSPFLPW
jgi:hypothetical protein